MSDELKDNAAKEASFGAFLTRQLMKSVPAVTGNLDGKVAIVTGANVGLGLACARQLLSLQLSHLILAVRSLRKGEAAALELQASFPHARVEVWALEMESYASIQAFVSRCHSELGRVDIAILNAGLALKRFQTCTNPQTTPREITLQVNFLSTVFLALLLLPILGAKKEKKDAVFIPGRLTLVGSDTVYWVNARELKSRPLLQAANSSEGFDGFEQYKMSKLFVLMFVAKLARDLVSPDQVIVNVACPGLCKGTAFVREPDSNWAKQAIVSSLIRLVGRTPEQGARVYLAAAILQGPKSHGSMISEGDILP
ncbi:hypothetical protein POX_c04775 [Penicillium oxalicum]|uniref:Short chain dehydrogenase opdN n=1 Tax=Penicillium oxalicum (strain 114-2 / CGMCC 5302) TaxID=933388 RepID=OPDN_PENO1